MTLQKKTVRRFLGRTMNNILTRKNLRLEYIKKDFDDRPLDEFTLSKFCEILGSQYERWLDGQKILPMTCLFDVKTATREFHTEWLATPFREQQGGSRFNNLLWLFLISKSYRPSLIIDSGTYRGASAWALSRGTSDARVLSFDINLSQLMVRMPGVEYIEADWTSKNSHSFSEDRSLIYFDDHVDQVKRIIQASERKIKLAIFDDDYPVTSYFVMASSPAVLPKIEFALDKDLEDGQVLEWTFGGQKYSWIVNRSYLDLGLSKIALTERLPNTSLISGIHQTPYRLTKFI